MWVRMRFDIGWLDLAAAACSVVSPGSAASAAQDVENCWLGDRQSLACLSVRTGLDLFLKAMAWPKGTEVLVSAVTIPDMVRVLKEHGLVPVPLDLDPETLSPTAEQAAQAITPRTKAILVAHLFGTQLNLDALAKVAARHGLLLLEDCAQAYVGPAFSGHAQAALAMFSFGSIKTNTALGGAILRVQDPDVLAKMRTLQAELPRQSRLSFAKRVHKYAWLKMLASRPVLPVAIRLLRWLGVDYNQLASAAVRGFPGPDFFVKIRHQPSRPLMRLLLRRLKTFRDTRVEERTARGEHFANNLQGCGLVCPGQACPDHSYWVFPVLCQNPQELMQVCQEQGFDATRGGSLQPVSPPEDRPQLEPIKSREILESAVMLPIHSGLTAAAAEQLLDLVRRNAELSSPASMREAASAGKLPGCPAVTLVLPEVQKPVAARS